MGVQPRFVLGILAQLLLGGCVLAENRDSGLVYQRELGTIDVSGHFPELFVALNCSGAGCSYQAVP
jgi:hypothetical protein